MADDVVTDDDDDDDDGKSWCIVGTIRLLAVRVVDLPVTDLCSGVPSGVLYHVWIIFFSYFNVVYFSSLLQVFSQQVIRAITP